MLLPPLPPASNYSHGTEWQYYYKPYSPFTYALALFFFGRTLNPRGRYLQRKTSSFMFTASNFRSNMSIVFRKHGTTVIDRLAGMDESKYLVVVVVCL